MKANDLRVLHGRSKTVRRLIQRLREAGNQAQPVTLNLRDAGALLTYLESAQRIVRDRTPPPPKEAADEELATLRLELAKTTEAWQAAERRLLELERRLPPGALAGTVNE